MGTNDNQTHRQKHRHYLKHFMHNSQHTAARQSTVNKPILIIIVDRITWNSTELFAIAAENLRREDVFLTAAVSQWPHHRIDVGLKHLRQLHINTIRLPISFITTSGNRSII